MFPFLGIRHRLQQLLENPDTSELLRLPLIDKKPSDRTSCNSLWESQAWYDLVVEGRSLLNGGAPTSFGVENNRRNICVSLNIDGFQPWKRINRTITPFTLMILNLPENLRHRSHYLLLAGLVPGPKQPKKLAPYLSFLVKELKQLYTEGFTIQDPTIKEGDKTVRVRVKLLFTCADYPAHSHINLQQQAGATYGCMKCNLKVSLHANGHKTSPIMTICHHLLSVTHN